MITENILKQMRIDLLKMALAAGVQGAHMGGSLSLAEIMATLYLDVMKINLNNMRDEMRDRLILSKGHGVMAQYVALKQVGLLSEKDLLTYKANNSIVAAHPYINPDLGIEFSSGSLGQGLSLGVGVALALRRKKNFSSRVFVILGDGECDEGSVWEAAASASHYGLNNLIAIVDKNSLQYDGKTSDVLSMENMQDKWQAFGWDTCEVDGHQISELKEAMSCNHNRPLAIIANTIKGKGISFMENNPQWHNGVVSQKLFEQALNEIGDIQ